jgi:hexosaminidase
MKFYTLLLTVILNTIIMSQQININIIPTPQNIIYPKIEKHFELDNFEIMGNNNFSNPKIKVSVDFLENELKNILGNETDKSDRKYTTQIKLEPVESFSPEEQIPEKFKDEAYILEIEEYSVNIKAINSKGIYYGVQSLLQLVESNNGSLPLCRIIDYPNMKIRGISDDFSRGQVSTMDNFKRIIDFMAKYKMNTYMPYMEDVIQFDNYPEIGVNRGALSKEEIREIVEYADERFIEVIPVFQTLGHYENILSQPEFIKYADFPGGASLDITNEETYVFLESLMSEVFELFPSKYFHIGADESYDIGLGNSRKLLEQSDLATVHANHYKRVYDICKKNNKEVLMYGDIILSHPEILEKIPNDITIVDWHYYPKFNYPSTKIFDEAGFNYITSPTVWNFNSAFPENFYSIPNIKTFIEDGINNNSIGMINSCWGDFGAETFREYNLYGYAWSAQCSWNITKSEVDYFNSTFFNQFFGVYNDEIQNLFDELNDPINQLLWSSIWRHPLLDYRKPDWRQLKLPQASKLYWMNSNSYGLENFELIRETVSKNKDFLDLLEFTLHLKEWFLLKQETQIVLHDILDSNKIDLTKANILIDKNIFQLTKLKHDYVTQWNIYNRVENLWMIEDKFDRLITYFNETRNQINQNSLESPLLKSKWIYYPNEEDELILKVNFSTKLSVEGEVKSAQLQIIGDTFAKVSINNKVVDSVYTKRSGSLWIEQQRIKLIDVTKYLKEGENEISVDARNYYDSKTPGINIIAEIITSEKKIIFMTDEEWQVQNDGTDEWIPVEVKESNLEIIAPNFTTNRKSWIER